tara:strand:+ start:374 stop:2098 length:1725 start_codon:yes stop_codon:yes gene_type:complete
MVWAALGKTLLKGKAKKIAKDKLLNRKKKTNKRRMSVKKVMGMDDKPKRGGALVVRPTMDLGGNIKVFDPVSDTSGESDIIIIRKQVIQVRDILKDSYTDKKEKREEERKERQRVKREIREEKLEKPKVKPKESKGMKMPKPGLGIGNFLSWLVFGLVVNKLLELLPQLKKIWSWLKPIVNFIGGIFKATMGFVVGFINLSYAGVEKLEKAMEAIGGKGGKELFEKFGKLFTQVLNGALIAALIGARVGLFNPFRRKPKIKQPTRSFSNQVKRRRNLNKRWFDPQRGDKISRAKNIKKLRADRLKRVEKFGRLRKVAQTKKFVGEGIDRSKNIGKTVKKVAQEGSEKLVKSGATKVVKSGATKVVKAGVRSALKSSKNLISPIVKKIPFIGALIDFALNYFVFKEPLGKSAFMAIGAGVGTWLGGMLGTLIPVPFVGTAIGGFLGGMGGDLLAGAIYDGVFGNKENKKDVSTLEKDGIDDKIKEEKTLTNRFDIETGKSYINKEEVSANEYNEYLKLSTEERLDKYGILKGHAENILPNDTQSKAEGLDTHPSYAQGGMMVVDNTTTYIQPIEV